MDANQVDHKDFDRLLKERDYYRKQVDELSGKIFSHDYKLSGLNHELMQLHKGFALIAELQTTIGAVTNFTVIFDKVVDAVAARMQMDRTVILQPLEHTNRFRPTQWLGYAHEQADEIARRQIEFPQEFLDRRASLLVNSRTAETPLMASLREALGIPFFVCTPVIAGDQTIAMLCAGRAREVKPLSPALEQYDADTFGAIAGLMAALIENIRIGVLEELDRQKTQFFSTVSHELRTPLTLILGPMEGALAGRYGALPAGLQNDLATVLRNARRLLHLISQLLDFSRLESQKMQLQLKPIALHDFLLGILAAFEPFAERKHQRHSLQSSSDLPTLYADPEKLEKILYNLLSNACKFSPEGASITLRASHDDDHALISVSDTGIGIRADQLPHIFDRFYQADGSASREYEGTGIGLWLVKELVNLHGGTIHVESVYGKGATFTFTLPIQPTDTSIVAAVEPERMSLSHAQVELAELEIAALASETSLSTTHPHTLLIVEDNPDMRKFIGNVCDDHYNILTAKDGVDGLEQARAHRPQLIISDIMMPKMDGYQLCQAIRRDEDLKHIPLILLTAKADVEMKVEGLEGGADDYLIKPFNSQELLARIKNLIQLREQEAQLKLFNEQLEHRVQRQVEELERIGRLRRFLSPQLAEMIVSNQNEHILESHRREITVVFCDLRGFTAFAETTEPEDVMNVLREFHSAMGAIIFRHEGTLERFAGDGMMIFFNDPVPCPNPAERAVHMAVEMRATVEPLKANWRKRGFQLDLGVGISMGYATLGKIGFEQRFDYAAIGTVTNLASRLCDEAKGGQILISQRVFSAVGPRVKSEPLDELSLKGLSRPVAVYNVTALTNH